MFFSNFYGFLLDEFGMLSRRAGFSATAELSCIQKEGLRVKDLNEMIQIRNMHNVITNQKQNANLIIK